MKPVRLKMPPYFRRSMYAIIGISWCSGVLYFLLHRYFMVEGEFGVEPHYLQLPSLTVHGASAFLVMMLLGAVFFAHIPLSWKTKRLRKVGIFLTTVVVLQFVSAYALYYLSSDFLRFLIEWLHLGLGVSLPIILVIHITMGKKDK